jgi:hypothetical protein
MKLRIVMVGVAALTAGTLSGCGGSGAQSPLASMGPKLQSVDTAQVLAQAQQVSETGAPYVVDGGVVAFTDTADTTNAMPVTGT